MSVILSCNTATKKETTNTLEESAVVEQKSNVKSVVKTTPNNTYLCKINGIDWAYTKASGIISTHRKTKKRTALITFKRKLEKGSESIQLHYDDDSKELIIASLQLKFKNKDDKLFTCYYQLDTNTKKHSPQGTMSGTIDLSNPSSASGTAEVSNINIRYEKETLLNPKDGQITLSNLKFSDVGYSDLDKLKNAFKK